MDGSHSKTVPEKVPETVPPVEVVNALTLMLPPAPGTSVQSMVDPVLASVTESELDEPVVLLAGKDPVVGSYTSTATDSPVPATAVTVKSYALTPHRPNPGQMGKVVFVPLIVTVRVPIGDAP